MKKIIYSLLMFAMIISLSLPTKVMGVTGKKAIVVIPGITGVDLKEVNGEYIWKKANDDLNDSGTILNIEKLKVDEDGNSLYNVEPDTNKYGSGNSYKALMDKLTNDFSNEYDIIFFPYDWRMNNKDSALKLQEVLKSYTNVVMIGNSMGGIVASFYANLSKKNFKKIDKLVTIGTPYEGSTDAILAGQTGGAFGTDIPSNVICNFPSLYELLPNRLYKGDIIKTNITHFSYENLKYDEAMEYLKDQEWTVDSMLTNAQNNMDSLVDDNGKQITQKLNTYRIYSNDKMTPKAVFFSKYIKKLCFPILSKNGDSVVEQVSATLGETNNSIGFTGLSHLELARDNEVINKIADIIKN